MLKLDFGRVSLPGGHERSWLSVWVGYDINHDDWRLSLGVGRLVRDRRGLWWREIGDAMHREFPHRRVWSLRLPRWLGECMTCPAPKLSRAQETAQWMRSEERRTGQPVNWHRGFIDG